jgi:hypothetical protein
MVLLILISLSYPIPGTRAEGASPASLPAGTATAGADANVGTTAKAIQPLKLIASESFWMLRAGDIYLLTSTQTASPLALRA